MKEIACSKIGGAESCMFLIEGNTSEEMIGNGWAHIESAHPDLAETIKHNPPGVNDAWMKDFHANFSTLPDKA